MRISGSVGTLGGAAVLLATAIGCTRTTPPPPLTGSVPPPAMLVAAAPPPETTPSPIDPTVVDCNVTLPPVAPGVVTPAIARSGLPCSVAFGNKTVNLDTLQQAFDFNSWLTFVALTAAPGGGGDGPAAWEGWQDLSSLMLPGGAVPPPFGTEVSAPAICAGAAQGAPVLQMISKTPTTPTIEVAGQPLNTGPLIDQNGAYVRYQILVNQPMYRYVVDNGLYSKAGQRRFAADAQFPAGTTVKGSTNGTVGAIVVKVAWKVLGAGDDASRFHATKGYVYNPAQGNVPASCRATKLGLVGMHIVHKTAAEPQWNWATFEHDANVPIAATTSGHFNFYNPACRAVTCPVNRQPPQPWNPAVQPFRGGFHSQIVRTTKYPPQAVRSAALWNPQFKAALGTSVLANYHLVTTQWPTDAGNKTDPNGAPFPLFAANTTMETYVQGNVPQASSSCMACHGNATMTNGKESDFSFLLEKAQ
jgi:hypothetical protein